MNDVITSNNEVKAQVWSLQASNDKLQASNDKLKASNDKLKASNDELRAEVWGLKASNDKLKASNDEVRAEVWGLKASNDELKTTINDQCKSIVLSLEAKVTTLEAEMVSCKHKNSELRDELTWVRIDYTFMALCFS